MARVLMVLTNRYDPDVRVYKEAKSLVKLNHEVVVFCWDREGDFLNYPVTVSEGIKIVRVFIKSNYGTGLSQLVPYFRFIREVVKYYKKFKFDYVHGHDLDGFFPLVFIRNKNKIFDMHEYYEIQGRKIKHRRFFRCLTRYLQARAKKVIYVNEIQLEHAISKENKFVHLPNYPIIDIFNCNKSNSSYFRVNYIGAVRQYELLKNLIEATKDSSDIKIAIHGSGVKEIALKEYAKQFDNVNVSGRFSQKDIAKLYEQTDLLFAGYSNNNMQHKVSLPVKLYEAIASCTPILVNENTRLADFVEEFEIGYSTDLSSPEKINAMLISIITNRKDYQKKIQNLSKIKTKYSWGMIENNLISIYSEK